MPFKIRGGTPLHGDASLCDSCRHSRIVRGHTIDEEIVMCGVTHDVGIRITFKVAECSTYEDSRLPSYYELLQQAWILVPASKRRARSGFVRASELRDREYQEYVSRFVHEDFNP